MSCNGTFIWGLLFCLFCFARVDAASVASDHADNDPYPVSGFLPGDNGGFGFDGWAELDTGTPGAMYTTTAIDGTHTYSWGLNGTYALGRGLAAPLSVGSWNFLAVHDADNLSFSGFNLKSSTDAGFDVDELFRVGMDPSQIGYDGTGVYISTNAGSSYLFLDCGWVDGEGDTIEYNLGWDTDSGTYNLSVSNQTEGLSSTFNGNLAMGSSVAMLGSGLFGATTNESLTFDQYAVVPEPNTLYLMAFSLLTLRLARRYVGR